MNETSSEPPDPRQHNSTLRTIICPPEGVSEVASDLPSQTYPPEATLQNCQNYQPLTIHDVF